MSTVCFPVRSVLLGILLLAFCSASYAQRVSATLTAGTAPQAIAVNSVTNKIYVANAGSNTVTVIDGATNNTVTVNVGTSPQAIAVNPATNMIYVANHGSSNVTVINGADNTTTPVSVGNGPQAIAVNTVTNMIYVANQTDNTVTAISGNDKSTTPVTVGSGPTAIAVNASTNKIYVVNTSDNTVTVIDGTDNLNLTTTVTVGTSPAAIAINQVTNKIYVANRGSNNITVINGANNSTSTVTDATAHAPAAVAINPVTNRIYVANQTSNGVTVIDGTNNTVAIRVGAGQFPVAITVDLVSNFVYVASANSNNVTVIDENNSSLISTVTDGSATGPRGIAVNPVTNRIYVANQASNNVTAIDGAANSVATVSVLSPGSIAVNPVTNKIYVANGVVAIIDGATNTTTTVADPNAKHVSRLVAVNPVTNKIYVANCWCAHGFGVANISVIDGTNNTVLRTIPAGDDQRNNAFGIAVNPVSNKIYVLYYSPMLPGVAMIVIDGNSDTASLAPIPSADVIAVNPVTNRIYVSDGSDVIVVDGASNTIVSTIGGLAANSLAVNPVTNKIYASIGSNTVVIDGISNSIDTTLPVNGHVDVNAISNRVYVSELTNGNYSVSVAVIDGATNTIITTIPGITVQAINPVTNKLYATSVGSGGSLNPTVTIIDGTSNSTTTLGITNPGFPAVNPVTNRTYVGSVSNNSNDNVTVIAEQPVNAIPLTTAITPFPNNQVTYPAPTVFFTTSSTYTPSVPAVQNVFYQLDTWQGLWQPATNSGPSLFRADLPVLRPGIHILYAYATDSQQGDSTQTGNGSNGESSPIIGQIAAYWFMVKPSSSSPVATLTSGVNSSSFNQSVTFTATISSATGTPTNSVSFYENYPTGTLLATVPLSSGKATFTSSNLSVGQHPITVVYGGDAIFSPAITNTVFQVVNKGPTQTALSLSTGTIPSVAGTSLTFTAVLSAQFGGTPTGSMTFMDGNATLGTGTPAGAGIWTFTTSSLTAGVHPITAVYGGDANFAVSTSAIFSQVVESNAGGASTAGLAVNGSAGPVNLYFGVAQSTLPSQKANFVVTVTGGTDGDSIVLLDGNQQLGPTLSLSGGQASYTTQLPAGQHNVQAVYMGNGSASGSGSAVVVVRRSPRPRPR